MLVLLIWSAFIFLFFSASHSKLISYVLPVAPALALIIGAYLPLISADRFRRHLLGYLVFLVVAAFGIIFLAYCAMPARRTRCTARSRCGCTRASRSRPR